jgi:16S rRNA (guanine(966)-N(2))-methyltransferase RsmD
VRIISGEAKGRRLRTLRGPRLRPTSETVRQAIFDILGPQITGARVLDLFAGSGALGIEALSRGAAEAVFVDSSREACAMVLRNLEATGLRGRAIIRKADATRWVARRSKERFGVVFIDPPYERGLAFVARILGKLAAGGWVGPGGTIVVEAPTGPVEWPAGFQETRSRRFGRTQVSVAVLANGQRAAYGDLPGHV